MYESYHTTQTLSPEPVEAVLLEADGSNLEQVAASLGERLRKRYYALSVTRHDYGIEVTTGVGFFATTVTIPTGNMIIVYPDGRYSHMGTSTFRAYFAKTDTSPILVPAVTHYISPGGRPLASLHYAEDESNREQVVAFINDQLKGTSPWEPQSSSDTPYTSLAGSHYELIAIYLAPRNSAIYLAPGQTVGIYIDDTSDLNKVVTGPAKYFYDNFTQILASTTDTEKETLVDTNTGNTITTSSPTTDESEYEQNRNRVYDALAIVRAGNASETDFEIATRDIMDLLAVAFDEGWSTGVEHAQVNPYGRLVS